MIAYSKNQLIITIPQVVPGAFHENLLKSITHVMRLVSSSQDDMPLDNTTLHCLADLQEAIMPNEFELNKIYEDAKKK